jgi:hypothetical protein
VASFSLKEESLNYGNTEENTMNKNEKLITDSIAQILFDSIAKLTDAIALNASATKYMASVLGYKADALNQTDENGYQKVKLELATTIPAEGEPLVEPGPVSFDDLMAAVNRYAVDKGREETIAIVKKFTASGALKEVAEEDYDDLMAAVL